MGFRPLTNGKNGRTAMMSRLCVVFCVAGVLTSACNAAEKPKLFKKPLNLTGYSLAVAIPFLLLLRTRTCRRLQSRPPTRYSCKEDVEGSGGVIEEQIERELHETLGFGSSGHVPLNPATQKSLLLTVRHLPPALPKGRPREHSFSRTWMRSLT